MDLQEREARQAAAERILPTLSEAGVIAVAMTFVDSSGIARVKSVPLERLPHVAAWGVGASVCFDRIRMNDDIAAAGSGTEPVGDLRILPDVQRVVPLASMPGWAWSPADRFSQDGDPHTQCTRLLLRRVTDALAGEGLTIRASLEIEWMVSRGAVEEFDPGVVGPAYGWARLLDQPQYAREVLGALRDQGVAVEQLHPEYAPGQLELSVAAADPLAAADTSVLVRSTIVAVGNRHGLRTSFSPKVSVPGVGNGGHVHLSLWRDGANLMAGGPGRFGLTGEGEAFSAGILAELPALLAIGAPSPVSYLRLVPSHWAGVYACWGLENREAALRMVTGSRGSEASAANIEVKCLDLFANPYLLLAGLLALGDAGRRARLTLPEPVDVDPGVLSQDELERRGIRRLPTTLESAVDAFESSAVLAEALGPDLAASIVAIRRSDCEAYAGMPDDQVAAALRWQY